MIFNSFTFIFICFLPCMFGILFLEKFGGTYRTRLQNGLLLLFSLLFFAWSGTQHLKTLLLLIVINYVFGWFVKGRKLVLAAGVILNLGLLVYYKYLNLLLATYNDWFHKDVYLWDIFAPLGISFLVFQCISYLIDVYRNHVGKCTNFLDFALYASYFPKLSQGPIVKYMDMAGQLKDRTITYDRFLKGLERFIIGMSKKVLIADILGQMPSGVFYSLGMGMDAGTAWLALLCFTLDLYMDFSGYSDMAIGMASMMGFTFKENFNFPYLSTSITEFWRRWHISLGAWFREYLYFPLGGSRKGNVYLHLFVVFLATGLWHGGAWVYLFWGMLHGVCMVIERFLMKKGWYEKIPVLLRWAGTFFIVMLGWITFEVDKMEEFWEFVSYLFGMGTPISFTWSFYLTPRLITLLCLVVIGSLVLSRKMVQQRLLQWDQTSSLFQLVKYAGLLACMYLCFITMVSENYTPFLYFQY